MANKNLDDNNDSLTVFSYEIASKKIAVKPFLEISRAQILAKAADLFQNMPKNDFKELHKKIKKFAPSGIAIHPKNKSIYIMSARSSTLAVLNEQKQLENIIFLDENTLPQPEGICFDAQNNLYISSEGKSTSGKLVIYVPQK
ncbi:SdiA-regulated domain-containing protein [Soonwooa sp.]|uniref:SdiA-regulated domain-containing protein n=1 Tax=Soonwooa sp. TaxID=1938592 RepID=UPI002899573A|nr:SdiA-regulated domain-containing protein [Soonwooa sp.]